MNNGETSSDAIAPGGLCVETPGPDSVAGSPIQTLTSLPDGPRLGVQIASATDGGGAQSGRTGAESEGAGAPVEGRGRLVGARLPGRRAWAARRAARGK